MKWKIGDKSLLEYLGLVGLLILILSMPVIIKKCSLRNGSQVVKAYIIDKVKCNRGRSNCFQYFYTIKNKKYHGEMFVKTYLSIGDEIEIEVSLTDPSVSFPKK